MKKKLIAKEEAVGRHWRKDKEREKDGETKTEKHIPRQNTNTTDLRMLSFIWNILMSLL